MTQPINPQAIMQRLSDLLDELVALGWTVGIRVVCRPNDESGRITFELGENENESNDDPSR